MPIVPVTCAVKVGSAVPYILLVSFAVTVTAFGATVRVPFAVVTFVKYAVLSSPALFLIT